MFTRRSKLVKVPFVLGAKMKMKLIRVYATEIAIPDITGEYFTVYTQEHVKHVKGLRINNPNVGFIIDGVFFSVGGLEQLIHGFERFKQAVESRDFKTIAKNNLSKYEETQGEL